MHIKFLEDGESPDIGTYKKGDEMEIRADIGNIFIARGIAEEIKPSLNPSPSKGEDKVRIKNKEVD